MNEQIPPRPRVLTPFPPVDFPAPEIFSAERISTIHLENGGVAHGYLRQRTPHHHFAYERFEKTVNLGKKGKILYGRAYEAVGPPAAATTAFAGRYRETDYFVVIKKLDKQYMQKQQSENPWNEIAVAQMIGDNHHVVGMHEALEDSKYLYMIMPYFGSDLLDALQVKDAPRPDDVQLLRTLASNLLYLQSRNVVHRDFSPENVIVHGLEHERVCPLIDFAMGLQCAVLENQALPIEAQEVPCGKMPYMSPEIVRRQPLSFGIDVWALGCTMFVVWTNDRLYDEPFDRSFKYLIRDKALEAERMDLDELDEYMMAGLPPDYQLALHRRQLVQSKLSPDQRKLLAGMLQMDPSQRMTAQEILEHPYLRQRL